MFEDLKPHIQELRKRLIIMLITILIAFLVCFAYWEVLLGVMIAPLEDALKQVPDGGSVIFTDLTEPLFTALKVSFFAAFIFSLPVIFWQMWQFIAPGLYQHEKKLVIRLYFLPRQCLSQGRHLRILWCFRLGFII